MSCPLNLDAIDKLKQFIDVCKSNPDILHLPELKFFKNYLESLGGVVPSPKMSTAEPASDAKVEEPENVKEFDSDPESDVEISNEGCIEPDVIDETSQKMGVDKEVTEEESLLSEELRSKAMGFVGEGELDKAIAAYTEAIEVDPLSALLFAKRGQVYLRLNKPNACIKDCTKALELNCDSAAAYKFRGRAYRLLGEWEKAAKDLRQACKIDFDEQTDEWLKEVTPNALKIEQHILKKERRKLEKEEEAKMERLKRAREARSKAAEEQKAAEGGVGSTPTGAGAPPFGADSLGDFYKLLQDPEIMNSMKDPDVAAAFQDISANPANFAKYQSNPKIVDLIAKLSTKFGEGGMNFPGFPGGMPGGFPGGMPGGFPAGNAPPSGAAFDADDNLD